MGIDGGSLPVERREHHELSERQAIVHHESHAELHSVASHGQGLHWTEVTEKKIGRVVVVAGVVLICEEWFAGVLRCHDACLEPLAATERIAQPMAVLIAEVAILVAMTLIEWNLTGCQEFVATVFQYIAKRWEVFFFGRLIDGEEATEERSQLCVDGFDHRQFAY